MRKPRVIFVTEASFSQIIKDQVFYSVWDEIRGEWILVANKDQVFSGVLKENERFFAIMPLQKKLYKVRGLPDQFCFYIKHHMGPHTEMFQKAKIKHAELFI